MKKFVALFTALMMIVSAIGMMTFSVSAAMDGDWVTSRAADDYKDPESYRPACGYKYEVDQGLVLVSADYTNNTPYTHVHTRTPYNLKDSNADGNGNSISIELIVTDFAYGGTNDKDHFVSFSLHSKEVFAPGQTGYGEGVSVLIRGAGNGTAIAQFFTLDDAGGYTLFSMQSIVIPVNEDGHEVYDFSVKYDGTNYKYYLCGMEFTDLTGHDKVVLDQYCADGAYVGVSLYTGETGTPIGATISKFQGTVPYGEDSCEPEPNLNNFAPIIDSNTIDEGKPALIWNADKQQFKDFSGSNLDFAASDLGHGAVSLTAKNPGGFIIFSPMNDVSYEASDFPVIAVLTKDCYAESGTIYYSAGKTMGAQPNCSCEIDIAEYEYNDGWCMGILDLTDDLDWQGRVNMIRADFNNIDYMDEEMKYFDVAYIATFRTVEDAEAYAAYYLSELMGVSMETTEKETNAPDDDITDDQTQPEQSEEQTTEPEKKNSCGSMIAAPVIAMISVIGIAFIAKKKD